MNKKIVIFLIIFVIIIIVGIASYFLFGKTTPPNPNITTSRGSTTSTTTPSTSSSTTTPSKSSSTTTPSTSSSTTTPTYRLVSDVNFYPETVPAEIALKANIGVTNLASAIAYASSKGYTVFAFDENTTIRGSPQGDIIFYREADISDLNFWKQGGGGVGPFRVYATTSSKLQTMPCPNTSTASPVSQIRDPSGICRNPPCSIAGQVRDVYGKCS